MPATLTQIAYELGVPAPISEIPELASDDGRLGVLREEGFERYLVTRSDPYELGSRAIRRLLDGGAIAAESVDLLVICSDSLADQRQMANNRRVHALCAELGLSRAYPLGISQSTCGNFCSALRATRALIEAGDIENAIIVASDTHADNRLLDTEVAVLSDGAAACVVRAGEHEGYRVEGFSQFANHRAAAGNQKAEQKLAQVVQAVHAAFARLMEQLDWKASEVDLLVPNNFCLSILALYSQVIDVPMERFYTANVGSNAHVYTADNLINLADRRAREGQRAGERVVLLSNGPSNFGFCGLVAC